MSALLNWFKGCLGRATWTQFLPRPTRKESNVPKLKSIAMHLAVQSLHCKCIISGYSEITWKEISSYSHRKKSTRIGFIHPNLYISILFERINGLLRGHSWNTSASFVLFWLLTYPYVDILFSILNVDKIFWNKYLPTSSCQPILWTTSKVLWREKLQSLMLETEIYI
jgi:hypothetical protein